MNVSIFTSPSSLLFLSALTGFAEAWMNTASSCLSMGILEGDGKMTAFGIGHVITFWWSEFWIWE